MFDHDFGRNEFFKNLSPESIVDLVKSSTYLQVSAGEFVYHSDQTSNSSTASLTPVFIILKGRMNCLLTRKVCFKSLVSGGFFGDIEVFNKSLRLFSVRAQEPSTLLVLSREDLATVKRTHPQVYRELARASLCKYMKYLICEQKLKNFFSVGLSSAWWEQEAQASKLLGKKIALWLEFLDEASPGGK